MKKPIINLKSDEVNKEDNFYKKKKWRVMMRKKLNKIDNRKRRKKKYGVGERIKSENDVEEPHA